MTVPEWLPWLAYLLGFVTPFALLLTASFVSWATSKGFGQQGCYVCDHGPRAEIGDHWMITMTIWSLWHRYAWSYRRWHREAWGRHRWNPANR